MTFFNAYLIIFQIFMVKQKDELQFVWYVCWTDKSKFINNGLIY